jgi:hypothetical protein
VKNWRALSLGESITPRTGFTLMVAGGRRMLEPAPLDEPDMRPSFAQPTVRAPTIEAMIAESDIIVPEDIVMSDDIVVPEEIVAPELVPLAPRIDMAALEQALSIGIEDQRLPPPVFDLDAIERRYPALRHVL